MSTFMDMCFLCTTAYNCAHVTEKIVSQVEYLLPEITIFKLGVPLRICTVCDGALNGFSKFKQFGVESSRLLEASIKEAQCLPLHTGSPPVVDDNETSGAKPEKMEETFIKEEYMVETPQDTQMHTDRASLNPIDPLETISAEPQYQNMQLHTDINDDNTEEIKIKEEQMEETPQGRLYYNKILKEECVSDSTDDDTDSQPEHTKLHSVIKNIQCGVCNKLFTKKCLLIRHMRIHTGVNDFQCGVCNKSFRDKTNLNRHLKSHSGIKDFQCGECDKSFSQNDDLNRHMKIHAEIKDFQCGVCGKSFTQKTNLNYHMKIHSRVKLFQCALCNKSFTNRSLFTRHVKVHTGVKDFQCDVCNKLFTRRTNLNHHMKIHGGVKDFQCGVCDKLFRHRSHLKRHIKTHSEVKLIQCSVCNKSYTRKDKLNLHMKIHS